MVKKGYRKLEVFNSGKLFYAVLAIIVLIMSISGVYALTAPEGGHTGDQIYVNYGTTTTPCYITLQDAIDNGYLN